MDWISGIIKRFIKISARPGKIEISLSDARKMFQMIQNSQESELSCDEVHALLDQYAEMVMRGEEAQDLLPLVHHHLHMCPDCKEEYEAIIRILHAQA